MFRTGVSIAELGRSPSPTPSRYSPMRLFALAAPFFFLSGVLADSAGLYPPGLLPIINRANGLLSAGQFNDAARAYSDAIGVFLRSWDHLL